MSASLVEKLEVYGFEEDWIVYKDGSLGTVLELTSRDAACATDSEMNTVHGAVCDTLNGLPSGLSLQFVQITKACDPDLLARHEAATSDSASPVASALLTARCARLKRLNAQGLLPRAALYLVIRRPFQYDRKKKGLLGLPWSHPGGSTVNGASTPFPTDLGRESRSFGQVVTSVWHGLEALGIGARKLPESEIYSLLFDQWNPAHPVEGLNFNEEDIRDDLVMNDLVVSLRGFSLGEMHHRVLSLKIMPNQTFAGMAEKLRELPFDSRLLVSIETLDQGRETFALETQRRIAYAMYAGKKGVSDLTSEAKLQDIEKLLARRVSGEEKVFSVSVSVILRSKNEEVLEDQVREVLQRFRELSGAEGMVESLAATSIFLEMALPNARSRERARRMNTSVLADFLPILGEWNGHEDPAVLLRTRRGSLIAFDPFSEKLTNFNQVVSGGSGAGKSFMTNLLIAQVMKVDPQVFILDIGGSYRRMTEALGGQYIALGADSGIALNPFDLTDRSVDAVDQKIKFLTSLVELMTKEEQAAGIGKLERSEIERMVQDIFAIEVAPRLTDLKRRLLESAEPQLSRMGKILGPWCGDAPYGKFIDRPTNLALSRKIVCFDLKGLESHPDLQAVALFLITDLIWREVQRDRTSPKFVVFDECWRLLESDSGARFIGEVFRTFRKYKASAIAISQTIDDFAKSRVATAILPNAAVKWVMKQGDGKLSSLRDVLQLNEREVALVESVTSQKGYYAEAFLVAGDARQVVVVESTPVEYWLATTDSEDIRVYEEMKREYPEASELELMRRLAEKYPQGARAIH